MDKVQKQLHQAFTTNRGNDLKVAYFKYALINGITEVSMRGLIDALERCSLIWGGIDICSIDEADNVPEIDKMLQDGFDRYKVNALQFSDDEAKVVRYFMRKQ